MPIECGEHVSIFGITGCGKSTLTRKLARAFPRRIIFDRLCEWETSERLAGDFSNFREIYKQVYQSETFEILIRPRAGSSGEILTELADSILALIYQVEAYEKRGVLIVFEEVWLYAPLHSCPPWFLESLLTGRHHRISICGNAQRPASVSKTLVSQSKHVFIGQFFEAQDRKYYRDCLGELPELDPPPTKFQFLWYRADSSTPQMIKI